MRWLICGTVPDQDFPLVMGKVRARVSAGKALRSDAGISDDGASFPLNTLAITPSFLASPVQPPAEAPQGDIFAPIGRGTPALAAAAALAAAELGAPAPLVLLAGDSGSGKGSALVYQYLLEHVRDFAGWGITFHYLLPDVDWHNRLLIALEDLDPRPLLCADAGFMYAAKMSGFASSYDLFTPDMGELAFLADEKAPHPFYTRGFLLTDENEAPDLIARAHEHGNSAKVTLVKGKNDLVVSDGKIMERISYPMVPNLEPIGGTGDTVAGLASGLMAADYQLLRACRVAALANRFMGQLAQPSPATQIAEILAQLPGALQLALQEP